jgi:hypothetical protein
MIFLSPTGDLTKTRRNNPPNRKAIKAHLSVKVKEKRIEGGQLNTRASVIAFARDPNGTDGSILFSKRNADDELNRDPERHDDRTRTCNLQSAF